MPIQSIQSVMNEISKLENTDTFIMKLATVERYIEKLETKYLKANEDKLTLSGLLTKVNQELEESLSNEKRFIASVSHELRTPLTAILGYSELLDNTALNSKQNKYLKNIILSSNHLLSLISDLLDVAKLEDNRVELSPNEFDLDDMLNECANLIRSKIAQGVDFVVDIPFLDYPIISDDKRLKQIFINLLSNAAKFTKKGSIHFYVKKIEELEDDRVRIVINVDDTANGIPAEVADTLFKPFQSTDKTQGTGLGLYISQQLAHLMEGEIVVNSKIGVGSHFSATIVVKKSKKREMNIHLRGLNIMMFAQRDEFVNRVATECMGNRINFQNYSIIGGDVATSIMQMIASGKFYDIAIFDMDVFKNNTSYIAGTLKTINPNIKLIAMSGDDEDKHFSEFDKVINKPIQYQRFIKEMGSIYSSNFIKKRDELDYSNLDILIVEDVDINREYEKEMLNNFFSIICDTAINGQDALDKARVKRYDLILMDMRMPIMDGLEATREIRKFDKNTPIICMSANVYKEDKLSAKESGMNDFIEKPLSKKDIEDKLIKILNNEFIGEDDKKSEDIVKTKDEDIENESGLDMRQKVFAHLRENFSEEITNKLLAKAISSIEEYVKRVEVSFEAKDKTNLVEDFHVIKGVTSNIGLMEVANRAGELQKLAQKGNILELEESKNILLNSLNLFLDAKE